jgi:hypothetical protein
MGETAMRFFRVIPRIVSGSNKCILVEASCLRWGGV